MNSRSSRSRSRRGSTLPSGCGCDASSNARTTCSRASESRSRARCSAGSSSVPTWPSVDGRWCGQVHVGHVGMDDLLRLEDLGQPIESLVGDLDDAHVHGDPAVAAGLGVTARQRVEDGGLARPGKADDGDLHGQYPAAGSTTLSSVSPRAKRPRLSQNSSMLRSRTRPLDQAVCGVTMTFGRS